MSARQKVVLITGCSKGGIGYSLCEEYAERGCKVYATARRLEAIDTLQHPNIMKKTLDVQSDEQVKVVVRSILEEAGRIDVLVNNAGLAATGALADVPLERMKEVFDVNCFALMRTFQAVFPHMAAQKSGTIVNIGSITGDLGVAWGGVYASSKGAVHRLTEVMYQECKPFNITVVLVAPGAIKSNIAANQLDRGIAMPESSLYKPWTNTILRRVSISQESNGMPSHKMAKMVVSASLSRSPPRVMAMGGYSFVWKVFAWLPTTWVINLLWLMFRKRG
ncbi:oxidoreductase [Trametopsis cervina]|nr:oxidoreductase [Trametopsis cervina]